MLLLGGWGGGGVGGGGAGMATFTKSVASPSNKLTNIALQLKRTSVQMNFQSLETNKKLFELPLCTVRW